MLIFQAVSASQLPRGASTIRYRLSYTDDNGITRNSYYFPSRFNRDRVITRVLTNLRRDTEYSVQLGVDYRYSTRICPFYIVGPLSNKLIVQTNATSKNW